MIVFCLNHGIGGKNQIIKQGGEEKKQKEQKGCVDIYYFWGRAGNMPAFDDETFGDEAFGDETFGDEAFGDETFGDEAFGDETFGEEVCVGMSGKTVESLLGQFVY